jgi:hypothetical protein
VSVEPRALAELRDVARDLETLLKNGEVVAALTERGVNASLLSLVASGLEHAIEGRPRDAADDFDTLAEELRARSTTPRDGARSKGPLS